MQNSTYMQWKNAPTQEKARSVRIDVQKHDTDISPLAAGLHSLVLNLLLSGLLVSGFIVFAPKFVESQFSISAAWAAQLIGKSSKDPAEGKVRRIVYGKVLDNHGKVIAY